MPLLSTEMQPDVRSRIPEHIGTNILPNWPLFSKLLFLARRRNTLVVNDVTHGIEANHTQLISDILHLRNALLDRCDDSVKGRLWRGGEVFINLLAPAGYEFAVGFLAIIALGAAVVPVSPAAPIAELNYIAMKSRASMVLTASSLSDKGYDLATSVQRKASKHTFASMDILPHICKEPIHIAKILISKDHKLNDEAPGLIIFTSGTTGPPKGALHNRSMLSSGRGGIVDWYDLTPKDVVYHGLPVHHATGIGVTLLPFIIAGGCIEFHAGEFKPERVWSRWLDGGISVFSGVPTMYSRLMQYFDTHIANLPKEHRERYVLAARAVRIMFSGSAALPQPLQAKWIKVLGGRRILERYGSTEAGAVFAVEDGDLNIPDGSVGKPYPGVDIKLANGDKGEVLVKNPSMFDRYIDDPEATLEAFTEDGYYKTGDIARRTGEYYFILGRASIDIIKSGGYKISALDIERGLLGLDYISEAIVFGVEDEEYGQRVAAAIVSKDTQLIISIEQVRKDLRPYLASYKLPTLLRIVPELRKTASGKVQKKLLKPELFPSTGHADVQVWKKHALKL